MELLLLHLLFGPLFIVLSVIFLKKPPKKVNSFYGYRTGRSMKNQETWDFANNYSAKGILGCGIITTLAQVASLYFSRNIVMELMIAMIVLVCSIYFVIFKTEIELKKRFGE